MNELESLEQLAEEFLDSCRKGERPSVDDYAQRFPKLAERVRSTFPALALLEELILAEDEDEFQGSMQGHNLDSLPERLGDYRILRELGRGGMGVVYEAIQESLGRRVALKVLPQVLLSANQSKRFEREARAAAKLHHTNIVPIFGVGADEGYSYYVMQLIRGLSLHDVVDDVKRLNDSEGLDLTSSTVGGSPTTAKLVSPEVATPAPKESPTQASGIAKQKTEDGADDRTPGSIGAAEDSLEKDRSESPSAADDAVDAGDSTDEPPSIVDFWSSAVSTATSLKQDYWHNIAQIGQHAAEALDYAHSQGVMHRDIKPSNLMLDERGVVWITDFGLAKTEDQENITHTGDVIGTIRYMAPERFRGESDPRCDVYSLGITLYELLALRPAFEVLDRVELMRQVIDTDPPRLNKVNPNIPRDLATIVHKAIERDPQQRIQSAKELAEDLRRFINDEPIRSRRVGIMERAVRWSRRNRLVATTVAVSALVILITVGAAFAWINDARRKADIAKTVALLERDAAQKSDLEATGSLRFMLSMYSAVSTDVLKRRHATIRDLLDATASRVGTEFAQEPEMEAAVRDMLGRAYYSLGLYKQAEVHLDRALALRREYLDENNAKTLNTMINLAAVYYGQKRHADGERLADQTVKILVAKFGVDDPKTLAAMNNLASNLYAQGMYQPAEYWFELTIQRKRAALGSDDPSTLTTMSNYAANLEAQNKLTEAHDLYRQVLTAKQVVLGEMHSSTLLTMNNLARTLDLLGDHKAAQNYYQQVIKTSRQPDHPNMMISLKNLGISFLLEDNNDAAQEQFEALLALQTRVRGAEDVETLKARQYVGLCLMRKNEFAEAEAQFFEILKQNRSVRGDDHLRTLAAVHPLVDSIQKQDRHQDAERLTAEWLPRHERKLGASHFLTGSMKSHRGASLAALERFEEAEPLLLTGFEIMRTAEWKIKPIQRMLDAVQRIAHLYQATKQTADAELWQRRADGLKNRMNKKTQQSEEKN